MEDGLMIKRLLTKYPFLKKVGIITLL